MNKGAQQKEGGRRLISGRGLFCCRNLTFFSLLYCFCLLFSPRVNCTLIRRTVAKLLAVALILCSPPPPLPPPPPFIALASFTSAASRSSRRLYFSLTRGASSPRMLAASPLLSPLPHVASFVYFESDARN